MPTGSKATKTAILEHLRNTGVHYVDPAGRHELARRFPAVTSNYLRRILRESGIALHPMVEGVRQDTFENLERTLLALREEYLVLHACGGKLESRPCRSIVIEARRHADLALGNRRTSEPKRQQKAEMRLWILMWLENPDGFAVWVRLRKLQLALGSCPDEKPHV